METNRLKQLCVVHETGNLRKAAEILNMSHSALSKSLKVLQQELKLELLQQHGRGIVLTAEGKAFVVKAQAFLDMEKQMLAQNHRITDMYKIGAIESFSTHFLGMTWARHFPNQPLQIHEMSSGHLEDAVLNGQIDVAITYDPVPMKDLEFVSVGKVSMGIYHRKGSFKNMAFAKIPFIAPLIPSVGTPSSAKGLDGWPEHESPRNIQYRVDLMESGLALARSGQGAIFIPDFVAKTQNQALADDYKLIEHAMPQGLKKVERRVFLVTLESRQKEKMIRELKKMIESECR